MIPLLSVRNLTYATNDGKTLLRDVSFDVDEGEMVGVIGPNGAGKTTLLRCLYQTAKIRGGAITFAGKALRNWSRAALARQVAVVPQENTLPPHFRVRDAVALGRLPYLGFFQRLEGANARVVEDMLHLLDLDALAERFLTTLSGGEKQRVTLARALAQEPRLLILDEPTNHLDVHHQLDLLQRIRDIGRTVIVTLHDLNVGARQCSRLVVLDGGRCAAVGSVSEVLVPDVISRVFHVDAQLLPDPRRGPPWLAVYPPSTSHHGE